MELDNPFTYEHHHNFGQSQPGLWSSIAGILVLILAHFNISTDASTILSVIGLNRGDLRSDQAVLRAQEDAGSACSGPRGKVVRFLCL